MTVEPGLGGQKLIPETIEKVKTLKIGFRFLPFLEKLWNRLSSDSVE